MASKDDDNTQTSSPIPGPPQHETPIGSTQSPTPLVHSPLSYNIPILAPSPIPLPQPQNPAFTSINEQKQQSSWEASMPHARRRSPDFNHQGVLTSTHPITNPPWTMYVYSQKLLITGERLHRYRIVRSKLRFESQLNDLFSGSLGVWLWCFLLNKLQD
jgi:hypothetical protein